MKILVIVFILSLIIGWSNDLETQVQTIELEHVAFACDCTDWVKPSDLKNDPDSSLILPDTLGFNSDRILFTGQFYSKISFPKGYQSEEFPDKAKVFRYTNYKVLESHYL